MKFLGVKINEDLKWTHHVSHIVKKISKYLGIFSLIRHFTPQKTLNQLYFIYPHLIYCIEVWGVGDVTVTYLQPLLKIQKKLARIITFASWEEPAQKIFCKLGWIHIYDLYKLHVLLLEHKQLHFKDREPFYLKITPVEFTHYHNTRAASKGNLFKKICGTQTFGSQS